MAKRIIFCADGTGDNARSNSNVYRLYKALLVAADQIPFYDDGIGADGNFILKVVEGAFGIGLRQKIKDGYTKIAHVYEAGDQIYLFGFSRGAFAVRNLANVIGTCGVPTAQFSSHLVDTVFDAYRERGNREELMKSLSAFPMEIPKIAMVGVWETIGALGLVSVLGGVGPVAEGLDINLHPNISHAYQALAIDEKRPQFQPLLWNVAEAGQTLQQVWFSGYHSDVGGAVNEVPMGTKSISDIPLAWMMSKAAALGLEFDAAVAAELALPLDTNYALEPLHPPNHGFGQIEPRTIFDGATLANSVVVRSLDPKLRPHNLKFVEGALAKSYPIENVVKMPEMGIGPVPR